MAKGECIWLCNTRKMIDGKPQVIGFNLKYHSEKIMETTGTTERSVVSDLTDES